MKENAFLCERWCMILQDGMVFLLLKNAVTGVLLLNSALTRTLLLNSSPCAADAPDLPFQLICGDSDFNLFVGKFLLFGQRVTWRKTWGKTWGKNVFCLCKFLFSSKKSLLSCNQKLMILIIIRTICKSPKKNFILRVLGSFRSLLL